MGYEGFEIQRGGTALKYRLSSRHAVWSLCVQTFLAEILEAGIKKAVFHGYSTYAEGRITTRITFTLNDSILMRRVLL